MSDQLDTKSKLGNLLESEGLDGDTVLYRETKAKFLIATEDADVFLISANDDPSEAVTDEYGGGYITLAVQIAPGLAFSEERNDQRHEEERVTVALRLGDALSSGSLVYPVVSVITEKVWYVTMPEGHVRVRKA